MSSTYQHSEKAGSQQRAIASHAPLNAITYHAVPALQKKKDEDELQMMAASQLKSHNEESSVRKKEDTLPPAVNKTGMPDNLKAGIENLSGISLDDVKVHYNSDKPAQLNALAYAQGAEIHVASGQERRLPHEAWHVVQQKQGRVRPTIQAKGVAVNDDRGSEKEAEMMGEMTLSNAPLTISNPSLRLASKPVPSPIIQGKFGNYIGVGLASILTGGAGALAYGAYRYYRHRRRENTINAIRAEQANQPVTLTTLPDNTNMNIPSLATTNEASRPQGNRNYQIEINPNNPVGLDRSDDSLLRIAELHERTHVSADMAYSSNRNRSRMWLMHGDPDDGDFEDHNNRQLTLIDNRLTILENIIGNDNALTDTQRDEMLKRVGYARGFIEYDPVINELLAYTQEYSIRANSNTVKALVELARENLIRRQPGGPDLQNNWPD